MRRKRGGGPPRQTGHRERSEHGARSGLTWGRVRPERSHEVASERGMASAERGPVEEMASDEDEQAWRASVTGDDEMREKGCEPLERSASKRSEEERPGERASERWQMSGAIAEKSEAKLYADRKASLRCEQSADRRKTKSETRGKKARARQAKAKRAGGGERSHGVGERCGRQEADDVASETGKRAGRARPRNRARHRVRQDQTGERSHGGGERSMLGEAEEARRPAWRAREGVASRRDGER